MTDASNNEKRAGSKVALDTAEAVAAMTEISQCAAALMKTSPGSARSLFASVYELRDQLFQTVAIPDCDDRETIYYSIEPSRTFAALLAVARNLVAARAGDSC
jgi:hypothetical protein